MNIQRRLVRRAAADLHTLITTMDPATVATALGRVLGLTVRVYTDPWDLVNRYVPGDDPAAVEEFLSANHVDPQAAYVIETVHELRYSVLNDFSGDTFELTGMTTRDVRSCRDAAEFADAVVDLAGDKLLELFAELERAA